MSNPMAVAKLWLKLMHELGYEKFAAHGGDFGAAVTGSLAVLSPDRLIGVHLTSASASLPPFRALTPDERIWAETFSRWRDREWGYLHLQRTRPNTPAFGLTDSPAGLAAWLLEKWWRWTDQRTVTDLAELISLDDLATIVSIYWFTRTAGSSMRMYRGAFGSETPPPLWTRGDFYIDVPAAILACREPLVPPRTLVERHFDLRSYSTLNQGGHFPALECPETLVAELRGFFADLRQ